MRVTFFGPRKSVYRVKKLAQISSAECLLISLVDLDLPANAEGFVGRMWLNTCRYRYASRARSLTVGDLQQVRCSYLSDPSAHSRTRLAG